MATVMLPTGNRVWLERNGVGPPLLQIHGSGLGHRNFQRLTPLLSEAFEVIDFDLPGFGNSEPASHDGGIAAWADDVANLIRVLGFDSVNVHGTSMGALIALRLAAMHASEVDQLVLSCCMPRYDAAAQFMRETWKRAAQYGGMASVADLTAVAGFGRAFFERDEAPSILKAMREAFSATTVEGFIATTESIQALDLTQDARGVTSATLLIGGAEDYMTPIAAGASGVGFGDLATLIPRATLVTIEGAGHYAVFEAPDRVSQEIKRFISAS